MPVYRWINSPVKRCACVKASIHNISSDVRFRCCNGQSAQDRAEARAWEKLLEVANLLIVPHSNTSSTSISPAGAKQTGGLNDGGMRAGDVAYPSVEALKDALTPPGGQPPKLLGVAGGSDTAQHPTEVGDARTSDKAAAAAAQHTAVGAGLFRIQINLARTLAGTVSESVLAEQLQLSKTGGTPTRPMFALVGDAAVTAHYRLGVVRSQLPRMVPVIPQHSCLAQFAASSLESQLRVNRNVRKQT